MLKWSGRIVSGLLGIVGLIWLLQGLGLLSGSYMSGDQLWAVVGLVLMVFSLVLIIVSQIWAQ